MQLHRIHVKSWAISMALAVFSMLSATLAHAADGCKFLLCIAGPWSSISQCVPTVHDVFRDLAREAGRFQPGAWVAQTPLPTMTGLTRHRAQACAASTTTALEVTQAACTQAGFQSTSMAVYGRRCTGICLPTRRPRTAPPHGQD